MRRAVALLIGVLAAAGPAGGGDPVLVVIVHPTRTDALTENDVASIYLERRRFWDDGAPIVALNLPASTPLRERFSRRVLHSDSTHLASYWNEQYFRGVFPPPVVESTDAVKRYVAGDPNAIGYVDASAVDDGVRVLLRIE
jgi:ABC-type phosphate transport system substrate-binding protein